MNGVIRGMRAFRHRNVRLILLGQFTSNLGYSAFFIAQAWLALELTGSPALVSLIASSSLAALFFFAIPAGVLADRVNRRRLMLSARSIVLVALLVEAALILAGAIQPWQMFVFGFVVGAGVSLDNPPQYKLLAESGPPEDIPSASALASAGLQISSIVGPLAGGLALQAWGAAAAVLISAAGNVVLLGCYVAMGIPTAPGRGAGSALRDAFDGLRFVATNRTVGLCLVVWGAAITLVYPYQALMAVFARDELQTDGFGLGVLLTAAGVGALIGASLGAYERIVRPSVASMAIALALSGAALAAVGFASTFGGVLLLLGVLGLGWGVVAVLAFTVTLVGTPEALRGRTLGMLTWVIGFSPVGSVVIGLIASDSNSRVAYALAGQVAVGFATVVLVLLLVLRFVTPPRTQVSREIEVPEARDAGTIATHVG